MEIGKSLILRNAALFSGYRAENRRAIECGGTGRHRAGFSEHLDLRRVGHRLPNNRAGAELLALAHRVKHPLLGGHRRLPMAGFPPPQCFDADA